MTLNIGYPEIWDILDDCKTTIVRACFQCKLYSNTSLIFLEVFNIFFVKNRAIFFTTFCYHVETTLKGIILINIRDWHGFHMIPKKNAHLKRNKTPEFSYDTSLFLLTLSNSIFKGNWIFIEYGCVSNSGNSP